MNNSILNSHLAAGALAALSLLAGCGTLPRDGSHQAFSDEQHTVDAGERRFAAPTADAPTLDSAVAQLEPAEPSSLRTIAQRAGQALKCGAQGALLGAAAPLLIASGTAGFSIFLIPITAPVVGVLGVLDGAKGACGFGRTPSESR